MGAKTYLFIQIAFLSGPHTSTVLNFEFATFNQCFCENFKFTIVPYGKTKNLNYWENE